MTNAMNDSAKPACCGECTRFFRNPKKPSHGWCDNWGGVDLREGEVCHPNFGIKIESKEGNQ